MGAMLRAKVMGLPGSQGSKSGFVSKTGKVSMIEDPKQRSWRQEMIQEMSLDQPDIPIDDAVGAALIVYVHRPTAHYRSNGLLKPNAPRYPKSGIDLDKTTRAIGDAAKIARWITNDARIAHWVIDRQYLEDVMDLACTEIWMWNMERYGKDFYDKIQEQLRNTTLLEVEVVNEQIQ